MAKGKSGNSSKIWITRACISLKNMIKKILPNIWLILRTQFAAKTPFSYL